MYARAGFALLILAALIVPIASARRAVPQQSGPTQDQNTAKEDAKPNSGQPPKEATADIKPVASDEGQLATVKDARIPAYAKVNVAPMDAGFENYIIAGFRSKKVPLMVVMDRSKADYEISGVSESEKAGWAKMLFLGSQQSNEQASIKIVDLKTGAVIFGYSVHKVNSVRGRQSAGEACAKHIKQIVID